MPDLLRSSTDHSTFRPVAEAILEQLQLWGVKRIYGVAGDSIFGLLDAIAKQDAIQFIAVKHESVAALMASAEAKCTGNLGVCAAQMGPGLANLLNGLGDAYLDGYPVLAITGQVVAHKIGIAHKQYVNQQQLVQALAGYTQLAVHPDAVVQALSDAIRTSISKQTVAHLSVPADLFTMPTRMQPCQPAYGTPGLPHSEQLQQALRIMSRAKRPMMLIGNRARPAAAEILQLAEIWGCGIAHGYGALGVIPDDSPYALGGLGEGGNPYLTGRFKEADVVLVVETSWWPDEHTPLDARIIQIETEAKLGMDIPVDCILAGDTAQIVRELANGLTPFSVNADWVGQIRQCKQTWTIQNRKEGSESGFPLHPARIVRAIETCASPEAIITLDVGDAGLWFIRNFRASRQRVLISERWRTMGFGLPAALAAKCCLPQQQVICLTGDGGLAMVLADLLTASRYQLPITVVVMNNGTLQMERNKMTAKGLIPEGTDLTNPDYLKLAEACGWDAYRVQSPDELETLLHASLSGPKPVLLDVPALQAPYPDYPNTK